MKSLNKQKETLRLQTEGRRSLQDQENNLWQRSNILLFLLLLFYFYLFWKDSPSVFLQIGLSLLLLALNSDNALGTVRGCWPFVMQTGSEIHEFMRTVDCS